uniref:UDP-glycosyltransferases domain-containing protein n=1 Tax=Oryza barthii TaxID=65489 RepID=A0A0D3GR30_9ORYZ
MAAAAAAAHVLVFPAPGQGHINCMMHFATGLVGAGLHVTFLHTDHSLRRLGGAAAAGGADSPQLRFMSIPDGLPNDHPRAVGDIVELLESLRTNGSVPYRSLLASLVRAGDDGASSGGFPPVTCVVADGSMPFAADVAEEIGVPSLVFRTASACSVLAYLSVDRLFELGEVPFPADGDLDEPVRGVPGMESFLRRRDLPGNFRNCTENQNDPIVQMLIEVTAHSRGARAVVLNTAASMEGPALAHVAPRMRDVFAIGPLHAMFPVPAAAGSLWRADDGCMAWLDGQPDRSVVYVSLGSFTVISLEQFTEFLHGLVAAGHAFLWVLRPDMAMESGEIRASAQALAREVRQDVADGGSSAAEFERLVGFIKELSNQHDGQFIQA